MRLRSSGPVAEEQRPLGIVHNPKRKRANPNPDTPQKRAQSQLQSAFKSLISNVRSSDTKLQLTAAVELRKLLSDDKHYKKVENANLVHRFEEFLHGDCPELQVEAAWFLIDLFNFTMYTLDDWYQHKRMQILLKLLDIPNDDVTQQAVLLLGRVASDSTGRDLVHKYDSVVHLLNMVLIPSMDCVPDKLPMLRAATETLLDFCKTRSQPGRFVEVDDPDIEGHVYQPVGIPIACHLEKVKPAYEALCNLVHLTEDEKVLSNVCSILSCLSDDENYDSPVVIHRKTCQRLVQLLNQDSPLSVVTPALCTLGNIAMNGIESEHIVEFGALPYLVSLLERSMEEEEVCRIIANITHGEHKERETRVQIVIDAGLLTCLLNVVNNTKSENIRVMAAIAISNVITGVTKDRIRSLVSCIEPLFNLLVFYHPDIVTASLDGLERILKDGESKEGENAYDKQIKEVGGLEKLKNLLNRRCPLHVRVFLMLEKYWPKWRFL